PATGAVLGAQSHRLFDPLALPLHPDLIPGFAPRDAPSDDLEFHSRTNGHLVKKIDSTGISSKHERDVDDFGHGGAHVLSLQITSIQMSRIRASGVRGS